MLQDVPPVLIESIPTLKGKIWREPLYFGILYIKPFHSCQCSHESSMNQSIDPCFPFCSKKTGESARNPGGLPTASRSVIQRDLVIVTLTSTMPFSTPQLRYVSYVSKWVTPSPTITSCSPVFKVFASTKTVSPFRGKPRHVDVGGQAKTRVVQETV